MHQRLNFSTLLATVAEVVAVGWWPIRVLLQAASTVLYLTVVHNFAKSILAAVLSWLHGDRLLLVAMQHKVLFTHEKRKKHKYEQIHEVSLA